MKIRNLVLICLLISLFVSCRKNKNDKDLFSDDISLAKVLVDGKLRVGVASNYPPLCFSDGRGGLQGFDLDILTAVADFMDIDIEFVGMNWTEKFNFLTAGKIDCIASGFSATPEREKIVEFSMPYFKNAQVIVVRAGENIKTLEDLKNKTVGAQKGALGMDILNAYLKDTVKTIKTYSTIMQAFSDLRNRGVDACITDFCSVAYLINQEGNRYEILENCLASDSYVFAFKKGAVSLKDEINEVLLELEEKGVLEKISRKWFGSNVIIIGK
ncbi:ABC transporter substrate-binding protein [Treponema pedis]|uniref:Amino acid ABC transporter amino acid-binding protein n=1 Tax=Treponema pedis str. T A4 TaxID=1291379 RepID=S6A815_9SPIR|nr:ABC transporter substrate-binding protein [Treponema pedis]AGT43044.1 amino acid ABC transporter amino acid-binding protein [Treponema pedis str. T A4]